jgi:putative transposase
VDGWGLVSVLIELAKSYQNGTNDSFNGEFRDECLPIEWLNN